ncbi:hypothetical protein C8R44DRAFT_744069 [Mycena epipterygia]|nr:hypothetical protein C8R44DRAFT_744069 [Mycena epipterygia]
MSPRSMLHEIPTSSTDYRDSGITALIAFEITILVPRSHSYLQFVLWNFDAGYTTRRKLHVKRGNERHEFIPRTVKEDLEARGNIRCGDWQKTEMDARRPGGALQPKNRSNSIGCDCSASWLPRGFDGTHCCFLPPFVSQLSVSSVQTFALHVIIWTGAQVRYPFLLRVITPSHWKFQHGSADIGIDLWFYWGTLVTDFLVVPLKMLVQKKSLTRKSTVVAAMEFTVQSAKEILAQHNASKLTDHVFHHAPVKFHMTFSMEATATAEILSAALNHAGELQSILDRFKTQSQFLKTVIAFGVAASEANSIAKAVLAGVDQIYKVSLCGGFLEIC